MKRIRSMSTAVRNALDERWPRVRQEAHAQLGVVEEFALAGEEGTAAQRGAARSAAHKLSGSLGMYGRRDASAIAAHIEDLLVIDLRASTRLELRALVDQLDGLIGYDPVGPLSSTLGG